MIWTERWVADGDYDRRAIKFGDMVLGQEYRKAGEVGSMLAWRKKFRVSWPVQQWQRQS